MSQSELISLRAGPTVDAEAIRLAISLEDRGHALSSADLLHTHGPMVGLISHQLLVSHGPRLSIADREAIATHKLDLLQIAAYKAPEGL